jgi:hypothetical protein
MKQRYNRNQQDFAYHEIFKSTLTYGAQCYELNWARELKSAEINFRERCSQMSRLVQIEFFAVVTPCSVVAGCQGFGGPCCLYLQGE